MIPSVGSLFLSLAVIAARAAGDTRAADLLKQARTALGGETALSAVQGLSCEGTFHRSIGDRDMTGDLRLDVQLPDKMLRTETMNPMGDATIVTEQGVNGDHLLRGARTMGGGPGMIFKLAAPGGSDGDAQALKSARADLARLTLGTLLSPSPGTDLSYGGEAESDDGRADILDAKGPGTFAARLFLDQGKHRPLMLTYRGVAPRMTVRTVRHDDPHGVDAAPNPAERTQQAELADIAIYFDDYRPIAGVMLPHHLSRSIDGKPVEEWTFKTILVNPAFKPDTFSSK